MQADPRSSRRILQALFPGALELRPYAAAVLRLLPGGETMTDMSGSARMSEPDRQGPPANQEIEQSLLGMLLVFAGRSFAELLDDLHPRDFYNAVHQRIYSAIVELIESGGTPDPVLVIGKLGEEPTLVPLGGTAQYIAKLIGAAGVPSNAALYIKELRAAGRKRDVADIGIRLADAAREPGSDIAELVTVARQELDAEAPARLTFRRVSDLADATPPERPWRVQDWIPSQQVTLLSGDGGIGKSLIAMQMQIAAAVGCPWLGLPINTCTSLGLYAEDDDDELHRRFADLAGLMGADMRILDRALWRSTITDDSELIEPDERGTVRPTPYFLEIERYAIKSGVRLIVLDAATNFYGADEIIRRQVNSFLRLLHRLALKIGGEVVLLSHPSLSGLANNSGLSGSTHWHNGVRSRLYFARDKNEDADPDERVLTRVKANYASVGEALKVKWKRGGFICTEVPGHLDRASEASKSDRVFMAMLKETYAIGTWCSPNPTARNYAPTLFARHPHSESVAKEHLENAMYRLLQNGWVRTEAYGPPAKQATRLVPA